MADELLSDEIQFSQFLWGRRRWLRIIFHFPLLLISKDYRAYRFRKLSRKKRIKKAENWAKKFSIDPRFPDISLDQVVGRGDIISILIDSIDYHILRLQDNDPKFAKMYATPPPKIFILESGPGWGKKFLAKAIQREALERGVKEGIKVIPETLKSSDISSWLMGVSEKQLENKMNSIFSNPTLIFIEQAQAFSEKSQGISGDIDRESRRIGEALERSLEHLKDNPIRGVALLSTNNFANIPESLRLIAERINLNEMKEESLIEICRRRNKKIGLNVNPKKLFHALSQSLRTLGKSDLTPSDINKAFILATNKVQAPFRESFRKRIKKRNVVSIPKPTIDDFVSVAPDVAAYTEEEVSTMVKETRQFTKPTERYRDVGGLHDVIGKVITEIKASLNPELATQLGYEPPIGFLFFGPPGSGKTLLAKAIAGEEGTKIRVVSGSEVYQKEVGETERNIRRIFSEARKESPSIIIWDEIDAVAVRRGSRLGDPVHAPATTILLSELEGLKSGGGNVLFIGITNRKDIIDEALLNRLLSVEFPYPKNAEERREIIEVHLRKIESFLSKDVTIDEVMKIFLQRTFSPRVVAYTMRSAVAERTKEVVASQEILSALKKNDSEKNASIRKNYGEQLTYLENLAKVKKIKIKTLFKKVAAASHDSRSYPLTLHHLERAFEMALKSEDFDELKEMQRIYRGTGPEIGKSYGLAAAESKDERRGLIIIVESNVFPRSKRGENMLILGTVTESVKESAKIAVEFLREYYPNINNHDVDVHIISPAEGSDREELKLWGPSAGLAIAVSIASAIWSIPLSPDVCMTGKIEMKSGLAGLVGGIHPKKGSGKIDIAVDEKFEKIIIPNQGFEKLIEDYKEYVEAIREKGTGIIGGKDFFDYLSLASGLDKEEAKKKLRSTPNFFKNQESILIGKNCKVDYSGFPSEKGYATHVISLVENTMPKVRLIHGGRSPGEALNVIFARNCKWPAATEGKKIFINLDHFDKIAEIYGSRDADDGAIVHEIDHAIMWAPRYDENTSWLIEGIADFVRDKLGFQREAKGTFLGSKAHFEQGKALGAYQTSAHFLMFLEKIRPDIVQELTQAMIDETYSEELYLKYFGKSLKALVRIYEEEESNR